MSKPAGTAVAPQYPALAWEAGHPERKVWSKLLIDQITLQYDRLAKAKDQARIFPGYASLDKPSRIRMFAEFFVALAWHECGWDPADSSVDQGTADDLSSHSVGLWQVSANDQEWAAPDLHYSFADLQKPGPNAELALRIMARQIDRNGLIILPNAHKDRNWATLLDGNKYQEIADISARVRKALA